MQLTDIKNQLIAAKERNLIRRLVIDQEPPELLPSEYITMYFNDNVSYETIQKMIQFFQNHNMEVFELRDWQNSTVVTGLRVIVRL